jgi:glyoxylase-like metal-dependent hydrolase (beta-lactamase superfamily II)
VTAPAELAPGLWRWLAPHPEWFPTHADGSPTGWERDVGCVLYADDAHAVFIDPLVPAADTDAFWRWADQQCDGRAVSVLETIGFHRRSCADVSARYGASASAPGCVEAHPLEGFSETVYWIPPARALIAGDSLLGIGGGEISMCPQSWLDDLGAGRTVAQLRAALAPLHSLDPVLVLVSHGEPALSEGAGALARALNLP